MPIDQCPICENNLIHHSNGYEAHNFDCPRCGKFQMSKSTFEDLPAHARAWDTLTWRPKISHYLRQIHSSGRPPMLSLYRIEQVQKESDLPTPPEQGNNLLLLAGEEIQHEPGSLATWSGNELLGLLAKIGTRDVGDAIYIAQELERLGLVDSRGTAQGVIGVRLTFGGWQRFSELKQLVSDSRAAFMAMPFSEPELDKVYEDCFRPAVHATGFKLSRIDEEPPAGSIMNRMRVEIHRARFLLAELTNHNQNVYWEAGLAEGLGRPVIYTCRKGHKPHFDTQQSHTVLWAEGEYDLAGKLLRDTIRATLPTEAIMEDDPG